VEYEVEVKFRVADLPVVEARLAELGTRFEQSIAQVDRYFGHPARDFARTDEALRIRQVGTTCFITYKGPKVDASTKTRREIELPLGEGEGLARKWTDLLLALGFAEVAEVRKRRRPGHLVWQGTGFEVALDEVERVGTFVELETISDEDRVDGARLLVLTLAHKLGLVGSERRSYLELLLDNERASGGR
jgi:adenylate cyclase class 2